MLPLLQHIQNRGEALKVCKILLSCIYSLAGVLYYLRVNNYSSLLPPVFETCLNINKSEEPQNFSDFLKMFPTDHFYSDII